MFKENGIADDNRRKHKRRKFDATVALTSRGSHSFVTACEVSAGGILLRMQDAVKVGEQIKITFVIGSGELVEENAEVIYALKSNDGAYYVGARFTDPSPATQDLINEYVES